VSAEAAPDTLAALVRSRTGDPGTGLVFEGERWSWAEIEREMSVRAVLLTDLLVAGPPHIGVLLDNVPEYLFLIGGVALSGTVLVGINPTRRGDELARDIRHADCQLIVTSADHAELLDGLDLGAATGRVFVTGSAEHEEVLRHAREAGRSVAADPTSDDLLMLIFTSGSTGAPKAVRLTQGRAARASTQMGFRSRDVLYCSMPVFHGNALMSSVFPAIASGATLVFRRRFSATGFLEDVRAHRCTFASTVGRALAYVLATPASEHDRDHELAFVLAPESSTEDMKAFTRRFGPAVFGGYGSSENAIVMMPSPDQPPEALGVPAPGLDVAVIDPATSEECARARFDADGKLLNADEAIGELVGRNVLDRFEGYYNNDEATRERTRAGWYWSGDLAYRDEDDVFYFAGRNADWLRVDGENFAAAPVERVIQRFPGVAGVAVFGVPDDHTADDQTMAVIELDEGAAFDPAAFDEFLAEQRDLGTKWSPRYVRVVPSLPTTATNKVDKAPLRRSRWAPPEDDAVYWRPERRDPLRPLTEADRAEIVRRFEANGRAEVLRR
jgi:fatty-acyl-CoA synthase